MFKKNLSAILSVPSLVTLDWGLTAMDQDRGNMRSIVALQLGQGFTAMGQVHCSGYLGQDYAATQFFHNPH